MEKTTITEKWSKTTLLQFCKNDQQKQALATILEQLRIFNGITAPQDPTWMRISIPVAVRIFENFIPWDIISVQPISSPCENVQWKDIKKPTYAKTKKMQTRWSFEAIEDHPSRIDAEAEMTSLVAHNLKTEITQEIITDLHNNSSSAHHQYKNPQNFRQFLSVIEKKLHNFGFSKNAHKWIVTSPEIANRLTPAPDGVKQNAFEPQIFSMFDDWTIYTDPFIRYPWASRNSMLMGMKDDEFGSPYVFSPYFLLSTAPREFSKGEIFCRYNKKLFKDGYKAFYSVKML